jgi:hypothetical protein
MCCFNVVSGHDTGSFLSKHVRDVSLSSVVRQDATRASRVFGGQWSWEAFVGGRGHNTCS